MQQTASNTSTTSTVSTKISTEHTVSGVAVPVSAAVSAGGVKGEQQFNASPASTTAQVITVVAPSHTTQAHGLQYSLFYYIWK